MRIYLFKKAVFNCRRATLLVLKKQDGKASLWEQVQLSYHKLYCNACRRFVKQSKEIDTLLADVDQREYENPAHHLPDLLKKDLQRRIDQFKK